LAHDEPSLRPHLLPILKESADDKTASPDVNRVIRFVKMLEKAATEIRFEMKKIEGTDIPSLQSHGAVKNTRQSIGEATTALKALTRTIDKF
jgi:hypothetical protein